jgi:probable rRNA maturation factor
MSTPRRHLKTAFQAADPRAIENRQSKLPLPLPAIERFLLQLNRELGLSKGSVFVCFVRDAQMKRLNARFRGKSKTTDVLSFPFALRSRPQSLRARLNQLKGEFLGDIAISPAIAQRNATAFGRTLSEEICILMLHGVLHLLGYDHETDRGEMERVETKLRSRLGLN